MVRTSSGDQVNEEEQEADGHFHWIQGFSDVNVCMTPSLEALQVIINTCEEFTMSHNLQLSTDPDPQRCKTKTLNA